MRRKLMCLFIVVTVFSACSREGMMVKDEVSNFQIIIPDNFRQKVVFPNPEIVNDYADIEIYQESKASFFTDLSFVGLSDKQKVSALLIGNVNAKADKATNVTFFSKSNCVGENDMSEGNKKIHGNSLVLSLTDKEDKSHYVVILDYANKRFYATKTSLHGTWSARPKLVLKDLTGDGKDEILVSNVTNGYRSGTRCEIFRCDNGKLGKIYSNTDFSDIYFSGSLDDNYKAVIKCKKLGFKKTISLLDCGYLEEDLEIKTSPSELAEDNFQFCRAYDNSRLVRKNKKWIDLYVAALDFRKGISFYTNKKGECGLKLMYRVYMGKWNPIGRAYAFMQYNFKSDAIELDGVAFKGISKY